MTERTSSCDRHRREARADHSGDQPAVPPMLERLTSAEVAELLGISEATLRTWRSAGRGPSYYRLGRVLYWRRDVDAWIAAQRVDCR